MTTPTPSNPQKADSVVELKRMWYAFILGLAGITLAGLITLILVGFGWKTASDIVAVVGLFTSATGTLIGTFFGLQIGSSGKEAEHEERLKSQKTAERALAMLQPADARAVLSEINL